MDSKSKLLEKYISKDNLDYLKIDITYNDDFYKNRHLNSLIQRECLKDPEVLKKYLTNLWFYVSSNKQKMIDEKIFTDKDDIDEFIAPIMTLVGIMSVAAEMKCKNVTWITMKY
jgi:nitrate/nitrite-specific signal transduction histidine kinase